MKIINKVDNSFSKEEQFVLNKLLENEDYILIKKDEPNEYFEIEGWTVEDLKTRLLGHHYFPTDNVALILFNNEIRDLNQNREEPYYVIFDNIEKYFEEFDSIECFVSSGEEKFKVTILTNEDDLDIDIIYSAKTYFINMYKLLRNIDFEYQDVVVKIS